METEHNISTVFVIPVTVTKKKTLSNRVVTQYTTFLNGQHCGNTPSNHTPFLRAFAKLRKASIAFFIFVYLSVRLRVCLFVRMEIIPGSLWTDFHEI
jgi:hypothetical protein